MSLKPRNTLALIAVLSAAAGAIAQQVIAPKPRPQLADVANFARYAAENATLGPPAPGAQRVVFMGDSITDNWGRKAGTFFPGKPYVNRGISGQTTFQMLLRFEQDVIHLHPTAVVILAGTNDVAENTGPSTDAQIQDNLRAMVELARANHIRVILASIPPAIKFPWNPAVPTPAPRIQSLNTWMKSYAAAQHLVYLDYYSALAQPDGAMKPNLAMDGVVHPNSAGYALMQPLAEAAIAKSLAQPAF
jgi:lysophospholipase L1-like esterase